MRNALPWLIALLAVGALAWFGLGSGAGPLPEMVAAPAVEPEAAVDAVDIAAEHGELQRLQLASPDLAKPDVAAAADTGDSGSATSDPAAELLDDLAELEELAAAGNPVAACRVAGILEGCRMTRRMGMSATQAQVEHWRRLVETATNPMQRDGLERALDRTMQRLHWQQRCSEVGDELLALQPYADLRAARLGDPAAVRRFVSGTSFARGNLLLDPALGRIYLENAWSIFEGMLQRGDQAAAGFWNDAVTQRADSPLWTVLPEEWKRPELAQALMRRTFKSALASQALQLDPLGPAVEIEAEAMF